MAKPVAGFLGLSSATSRFARGFVVVALALGLGGCLQPVNQPTLGQSGAMRSSLAEVSVPPIDGYIGHILKSELDFLFTGGAPAQGTRYQLKVQTKQSLGASLIDVATSRAQSATLQIEVVYALIDTKGNTILASGKTFASSAFDRSQMRYASSRAQRDAEERVAKTLAERLRVLTVAGLSRGQSAPKSVPRLSSTDDSTSLDGDPTEN